jgi:mannan endo-1,4-beta-mannosidase
MKNILPFLLLLAACSAPVQERMPLVDKSATPETVALFESLMDISRQGTLFGHQDDLAYGVHWKREEGRSDVLESGGAYPAVYGWDISEVGIDPFNIDTVDFGDMARWIRESYARGAVNTLSWHMRNPNGGSSWDTTRAVYQIIPGGERHAWYRGRLDAVADFLNSLTGPGGEKVPVIFRPFHEHTGKWFWWGRGNCTREEYISLWRFTVEYLRDAKGIRHVLYAYSTDVFRDEADYLDFYPGDDYVDILAFDDYHGIRSQESLPGFIQRLQMLAELGQRKNKVVALSETGLERIPEEKWWTETLLKGLKEGKGELGMAYVLIWRNANEGHHYAPYAGHATEADFRAFRSDPAILFEDELPDLYGKNK